MDLFWFCNLIRFSSVKQAISGHHPLESVVRNKDQMVDQANFAMLKTTQGIHAPLRLMMERKAACQVGRLPFLASSNLMKDVLEGKDDVIGFEDILNGNLFINSNVY